MDTEVRRAKQELKETLARGASVGIATLDGRTCLRVNVPHEEDTRAVPTSWRGYTVVVQVVGVVSAV